MAVSFIKAQGLRDWLSTGNFWVFQDKKPPSWTSRLKWLWGLLGCPANEPVHSSRAVGSHGRVRENQVTTVFI